MSRTKLVIECNAAGAGRALYPALVNAIARGHAWFDDLVSCRARSINAIATREGLTPRYVARLLDLAFLPSALVEDILEGRQAVEVTAERVNRAVRPLLWRGA